MAAPLVVFSHLRWGFVYQRPQHVLSRLAAQRRVIFIEEPMREPAGQPFWHKAAPGPNVLMACPHTPLDAPATFCDAQTPLLQAMLRDLAREEGLDDYVLWFYTPMALPLADGLQPRAIVYDCMDELSAFLGAPPQLLELEAQLLERADVVFTGGPSLYRSKRHRHPNVHCFPSSVDAPHFAQASGGLPAAADLADLPHPRLGFFGVIDERFDLPLLDVLARARPDWQWIMVGPVVKIDPAGLPHHSNIHWLGQRRYEELPSYLAGWDVCLLPFARNEATRFISPTKTLEYMAAQKMIVSTPITDVAEPYGEIVYLGDTPAAFLAACEQALNAGPAEREARQALMRRVLSDTSWDRTATAMAEEIEQAIARRSRPRALEEPAARAPGAQSAQPQPDGESSQTNIASQARTEDRGIGDSAPAAPPAEEPRANPSMPVAPARRRQAPVIVIGAGPTGLSAAYHLGADALLLEKNDRVGGWCRSVFDHGFTFDLAGHIMFSNDPYVHDLYQKLLGDNVHWQDREAWCFTNGVYTRYPFQGCLYGLPVDVIVECIVGAIEARFGSLAQNAAKLEGTVAQAAAKTTPNPPGAPRHEGRGLVAGDGHGPSEGGGNGACRRDPAGDVKDCCGDGVLESEVELAKAHHGHRANGHGNGAAPGPRNFEEFIHQVWGRGIAKHFAIPYNRKLWAVPLTEMETSWLGGRVPMPNIEEMIRYALTPAAKPMGPNARFGYPLRGGFQALMDGFLPHVQHRLRLNTPVIKVSPRRRTVTTTDGRELPYDLLISTMPLPVLVRIMGEEAPPEVRATARRLRYVSVRCVNLGVGREHLTDKHWIYYPGDTVFHRIFVQGNASPYCNPPGGCGLTCEITYSPGKPLPCEGEELVQRCIEDCRKVGMIQADDPILTANQTDLPMAYVVYDHGRAEAVRAIRAWLREQDIILAGRYSEWEYYNSDHAFMAGKRAAELVRQTRTERGARATAAAEQRARQGRPGVEDAHARQDQAPRPRSQRAGRRRHHPQRGQAVQRE